MMMHRKTSWQMHAICAVGAGLLVVSALQAALAVETELRTSILLEDGARVTVEYNLVSDASTDQAASICQQLEDSSMSKGSRAECEAAIAHDILEAKLFRYYSMLTIHDREVLDAVLVTGIDVSGYEPETGDGVYVEGITPWYMSKVRELARLLEQPHVRTYCETGFNGGHSAALALALKPDLEVWSFDLGDRLAAPRAVARLQKEYPEGNLHVLLGDTRHSLPATQRFLERHNRASLDCDVIFVDGGHTEEVALSDLTYLASLSRFPGRADGQDSGNHLLPVVLLDDSGMAPVRAAWERAIAAGWLQHETELNSTYAECHFLQQNPQTLALNMIDSMECEAADRLLLTLPKDHDQQISSYVIGRFTSPPPVLPPQPSQPPAETNGAATTEQASQQQRQWQQHTSTTGGDLVIEDGSFE